MRNGSLLSRFKNGMGTKLEAFSPKILFTLQSLHDVNNFSKIHLRRSLLFFLLFEVKACSIVLSCSVFRFEHLSK